MNTVEYMYVLFLTPYGKNYGCLAFNKANISNGEVRIAGSFCNPNDKHLFSKNQAIKLANENFKYLRYQRLYINRNHGRDNHDFRDDGNASYKDLPGSFKGHSPV